ncbi:hypothetical protein IW261DRAFT_1649520 [Armillaria novae-zelandiae]|uniref:Uncharacterized protein n=1 Tax=Armillaria novae-zelandiae TaxID=153914 RepID=A0AA39NZ89_9AGAR|nr:hypothetical protein IW261DRAFT_1649520 [Armillaria novae-zelandiae]
MARPMHFLSIPLGQTHLTLRARVADFHAALNLSAPDSTLLAGPQWVHLTLGIMNLTWPTLHVTSIPPSAFLHPLRALVLILGVMILMPDSLPTAPPSVDCLDPLASINNLPPVQPSVLPTSLPSVCTILIPSTHTTLPSARSSHLHARQSPSCVRSCPSPSSSFLRIPPV